MRSLALLLLTLTLLKAFSLTQLWSYGAGNTIEGLAFSSNGNLGAASWDYCAYIFDPNGNLLNKVCENGVMLGVSYSNGRFGFINWDDYAYITDESGNFIKKVYVGDAYDHAITMTPNGFVACGGACCRDNRCAFFDFNGNKLWDVGVGEVYNGPSYYQGYWYVADYGWNKLLIIKDGSIVNSIYYGESAYDTAVCGNYLAVSTKYHLYLYDLSDPTNPKEIWKVGVFKWAFQVAFSPDCKYIAIADTGNYKLKIYDIKGNLVLDKDFNSGVVSVAWWKDRIAVGLDDGRIYVYKVEGYNPTVQRGITSPTISSPNTVTITSTYYVTKSIPYTVTTTLTRFVTETVTSVQPCTPTVTLTMTVPSAKSTYKLPNSIADIIAPYLKLEQLYKQISGKTEYKYLLLKGPFQRNVMYLTKLSSLVDILTRLNKLYFELNSTLDELSRLVRERPTLGVVFKIMSLVQKAKVTIALLNNTLGQADKIERDMVKDKPIASCQGDPSSIINGILNSKDVLEIAKYRREAREYGGLDGVVKCLIAKVIDRVDARYKTFRDNLIKAIKMKEKQLKEYESIAKDLSLS